MSAIEKTLVLVKPDGVKKHICGEVISRFERKGLEVEAIKMIHEAGGKSYLAHFNKRIGLEGFSFEERILQGSYRFHHFWSCTRYGYQR